MRISSNSTSRSYTHQSIDHYTHHRHHHHGHAVTTQLSLVGASWRPRLLGVCPAQPGSTVEVVREVGGVAGHYWLPPTISAFSPLSNHTPLHLSHYNRALKIEGCAVCPDSHHHRSPCFLSFFSGVCARVNILPNSLSFPPSVPLSVAVLLVRLYLHPTAPPCPAPFHKPHPRTNGVTKSLTWPHT